MFAATDQRQTVLWEYDKLYIALYKLRRNGICMILKVGSKLNSTVAELSSLGCRELLMTGASTSSSAKMSHRC